MPPLHADDAAAFAKVSRELLAEPQVALTLQKIVDLAVETVAGCEYAGITMRHGKRVETPASTDPLVDQLDRWQYELKQGPCVDAVFVDDMYLIEDMASEDRWPQWTPKAVELGVMSSLSVRVTAPAGIVAGLNLYAKDRFAYDDQDQILTAQIYASHAGNALWASSEIEGQGSALMSRHQIGMAQGMLMQRFELTDEQAFQFLRRVSQDTNTKLIDVAAKIINEAQTHGKLT